jgi:hypothetical protein
MLLHNRNLNLYMQRKKTIKQKLTTFWTPKFPYCSHSIYIVRARITNYKKIKKYNIYAMRTKEMCCLLVAIVFLNDINHTLGHWALIDKKFLNEESQTNEYL